MRARAIVLAGAFALSAALPAAAQQTIKIGELNSYKAQPAFLDPYKKGWEMAIEEINARRRARQEARDRVARRRRQSRRCGARRGGIDDRGGRQHALRHVPVECRPRGHRVRRQEEGVLPRRRAADRQDHLAERQPLYLPPAPLDLHAGGDAVAGRAAAKKKRWALVYPNFEYGQSAAAASRS